MQNVSGKLISNRCHEWDSMRHWQSTMRGFTKNSYTVSRKSAKPGKRSHECAEANTCNLCFSAVGPESWQKILYPRLQNEKNFARSFISLPLMNLAKRICIS